MKTTFKYMVLGLSLILCLVVLGLIGPAARAQGTDPSLTERMIAPLSADTTSIVGARDFGGVTVADYNGRVAYTGVAIGDGDLTIYPVYLGINVEPSTTAQLNPGYAGIFPMAGKSSAELGFGWAFSTPGKLYVHSGQQFTHEWESIVHYSSQGVQRYYYDATFVTYDDLPDVPVGECVGDPESDLLCTKFKAKHFIDPSGSGTRFTRLEDEDKEQYLMLKPDGAQVFFSPQVVPGTVSNRWYYPTKYVFPNGRSISYCYGDPTSDGFSGFDHEACGEAKTVSTSTLKAIVDMDGRQLRFNYGGDQKLSNIKLYGDGQEQLLAAFDFVVVSSARRPRNYPPRRGFYVYQLLNKIILPKQNPDCNADSLTGCDFVSFNYEEYVGTAVTEDSDGNPHTFDVPTAPMLNEVLESNGSTVRLSYDFYQFKRVSRTRPQGGGPNLYGIDDLADLYFRVARVTYNGDVFSFTYEQPTADEESNLDFPVPFSYIKVTFEAEGGLLKEESYYHHPSLKTENGPAVEGIERTIAGQRAYRVVTKRTEFDGNTQVSTFKERWNYEPSTNTFKVSEFRKPEDVIFSKPRLISHLVETDNALTLTYFSYPEGGSYYYKPDVIKRYPVDCSFEDFNTCDPTSTMPTGPTFSQAFTYKDNTVELNWNADFPLDSHYYLNRLDSSKEYQGDIEDANLVGRIEYNYDGPSNNPLLLDEKEVYYGADANDDYSVSYTYYDSDSDIDIDPRLGLVETQTSGMGFKTSFDYRYGQVSSITKPDDTTDNFTINYLGQITNQEVASVTSSRQYYPGGLLKTESFPLVADITYNYSDPGASGTNEYIERIQGNQGKQHSKTNFDAKGLVKSREEYVHSPIYTTIEVNEYDSLGSLTQTTNALEGVVENKYDVLGRLLYRKSLFKNDGNESGTITERFNYSRQSNGDTITKKSTNQKVDDREPGWLHRLRGGLSKKRFLWQDETRWNPKLPFERGRQIYRRGRQIYRL